MNIDFIVQEDLVNDCIYIIDNTRPTTLSTGQDINTLILTITSDKLEESKVFDCVKYIQDTLKDKELYKITPEDLGLETFVDGLFIFSLSANDSTPVIYPYIFYSNMLREYEEKAKGLGYKVNISGYDYIQYIDDEAKNFIEEIRIVGAIIDELKNQRYINESIEVVELTVNDLLFKGTRILEVINI